MQIGLGSFIKLFSVIFLAVGMVGGVLALIFSFFGVGDVTATVGNLELTGVKAGIVSFFLFPLVFYLFGLIFGLVTFLPFHFLIKLTQGLNLKAQWG